MTSAARLRPHLRRRCSTRNHAGKVSLGWSLGAARDDAEAARAPPPDARVSLFVADIDETASWLSTLIWSRLLTFLRPRVASSSSSRLSMSPSL